MNDIKVGDFITSEDSKFLFEVIDEGKIGRGVRYVGSRTGTVRYAPSDIKKDTNIAEFVGEHLVWNPDEDITSKNNTAFEKKRADNVSHLVALNRSEEHLIIPKDECAAFLLNTKPKSNNCKISISGGHAYVRTLKTVKPGDILYLSYGVSYMSRMNKEKPKEKPKPKLKKRDIIIIDDSGDDTEPECDDCGKRMKNHKDYLKHLKEHLKEHEEKED